MEKALDDPRIKETLAMLAEGKTKEEIAAHYKHKSWKTLDMYFRRRGFKWDGTTYILPQEEQPSAEEDALVTQTKAAQIIRQLGQRYADIEAIALRHGFSTIDELGNYMKSEGYVWDSEKNTYAYDETVKKVAVSKQPQPVTTSIGAKGANYEELLAFLARHQDRLIELLEAPTDATLPRYKFKGAKVNKTLGLPSTIQVLLGDYSKEFNVTQRDVVEVALADFFKKYGYEDRLHQILLV